MNFFKNLSSKISLWSSKSTKRKIFEGGVLVGLGTIFFKGFAMLKEIAIAYYFGTQAEVDAFIIALLIPSFLVNVIVGATESSFVPIFVKLREEADIDKAKFYYANIFGWFIVLLAFCCMVMLVFEGLIMRTIASDFSTSKLEMTKQYFQWLVPITILQAINLLWARLLNTKDKYFVPSISPAIVPITMILWMVLAHDEFGGLTLVIGVFTGYVIETLLLVIYLYNQNFWVWPRLSISEDFKNTLHQFYPMIIGALLMSSAPVIDNSMAAWLGNGKVAALNYGLKIPALFFGIGSLAIGVVLLPNFSKLTAQNKWNDLKENISFYSKAILLVSIPIVLGGIVYSNLLIEILFERGEFTSSSTLEVASIQSYYFLQIPFYVLGMLYTRVLNSHSLNNKIMWIASVNLALNIILNFILIALIGVSGIALSTSIVYILSSFLLFRVTTKILNNYAYESR